MKCTSHGDTDDLSLENPSGFLHAKIKGLPMGTV